ncbi:ATP-binding cassette domain-containing protein [Streptomyces silvensis]|uniref:ABC transporter ATP-binding protein n=1 Tax=Streptomyces silvensis TaxID=1765722 RepID=A0A0W7WTP9_9ACTN|nr:ATP-binding cassette domain-containing protein [Streptomyces silvensis]KUF13971.1 ABC transporter ATP-binding protein [Streptomyces silvensis]
MDGRPYGAAVDAADFGLKGPRGWAFRGVGISAGPGALVAVEGPSGSGRTCLLLALTGRMRATEGTAAVGRFRLPAQLAAARGISAVANVPGVTDLDPALTVAEHLRERALLERRFGSPLRALLRPRAERAAASRLRVDDAVRAAGLDVEALPKGSRTSVRDLERLDVLRLSVALALMGGPRLLGVDDVDLKLSDGERDEAWALLRSVAERGTTVVAVCREAPPGVVVVSTAPSATRACTDTPREADAAAAAATATDSDTDTEAAADADSTAATYADAVAADAEITEATEGTEATDKETADAVAEARRA